MIAILIELLFSWLLLKYLQEQNLNALGLVPNSKRLSQLLLGLLWPVLLIGLFEYLVSVVVHNPYRLNPAYGWADFWKAASYVSIGACYEDLIFRGALLYILMRRMGDQRAMLISATAFGSYHWFSYQVFGNPIQMVIVFLNTAAAGYVFALAFVKTKSMYLPLGLHLGANLVRMVIFSKAANIGPQLLQKQFVTDPFVPNAWVAIPVLVFHFTGFLVLTFWALRHFTKSA